MRIGVRFLFLAVVFVVMSVVAAGGVRANDITTFDANVFVPTVKINVPTSASLGNVTQGFSSDKLRIDVENVGTTAVLVTPQLADANEQIFKYLYFARRTTEEFKRIGDFSLSIPKPSAPGKIEKDYFYAKLDLSKYSGTLRDDVLGHKADVVFWALPQ